MIGFCASAIAAGCTVSSGGDDDDGFAGEGGEPGDSGTTGGAGGASGGSGGTAGGSAGEGGSTGGTAGSGGSGGEITCRDNLDPTANCSECVETRCCQEWLDCTDEECAGTEPDGSDGEAQCIIDCMFEWEADGGVPPVSSDITTCATRCAKGGDSVPAISTNDLLACIAEPGDSGANGCAEICLAVVD
jgi:hypothetical protein